MNPVVVCQWDLPVSSVLNKIPPLAGPAKLQFSGEALSVELGYTPGNAQPRETIERTPLTRAA